jgi:hypothetical protein
MEIYIRSRDFNVSWHPLDDGRENWSMRFTGSNPTHGAIVADALSMAHLDWALSSHSEITGEKWQEYCWGERYLSVKTLRSDGVD